MKPQSTLLVEGVPGDVELTRRTFQKNNIFNELIVAENEQETLDYLFSGDLPAGPKMNELPAPVWLDPKLPRVEDLHVQQGIRADERTSHRAVVMLTSFSEEDDISQSYDLCANSTIRKPVDFKQFVGVVWHPGLY